MKILSRPGFVVRAKGISYNADNLAIVTHEGVWSLSFICSGGLMVVPARDIEEIKFNHVDGHHCNHCDQPLKSWPCNESEPYVREVETAG